MFNFFFENGQFVCRHPVLSNFMEKKQVFRQAVLFPELYASLIEVLVSSYFSFILIQNTCVEETFIKMNDRDKIFLWFSILFISHSEHQFTAMESQFQSFDYEND